MQRYKAFVWLDMLTPAWGLAHIFNGKNEIYKTLEDHHLGHVARILYQEPHHNIASSALKQPKTHHFMNLSAAL